jgi:phosphomannomutase
MPLTPLNADEKTVRNADKLFKGTSYDIRAYVGEPDNFFSESSAFTPDSAKIAGLLMGGLEFHLRNDDKLSLKEGEVCVIGYDNGPTSQRLAEAFAEGLSETGVNVYLIGISGSGQVYQNQNQLGAQAHVQITRSHVEVTTNGAKFGIGTQGIHTYLLKQMNEALKSNALTRRSDIKGKITDKTNEAYDIYFRKMVNTYKPFFKKQDTSKTAVNLFGGTGCKYTELFKEILGPEVLLLGADLDVNSGEALADPTRNEMIAKVKGFQDALDNGYRIHSFDLDADRGSVTYGKDALKTGCIGHYLGDGLAYILADYKLKKAVPALIAKLIDLGIDETNLAEVERIAKTIYIDARYTSGVKSYVESLGGTTVFHTKGHSLWKETITSNMLNLAKLSSFATIADFVKATGYRDYQIEASLHFFTTDVEDGIPRDDAVENIFVLEQIFAESGIHDLNAYFENIPSRFITKEIRTTSVSNEAKEKITYEIMKVIKNTFGKLDNVETVEFDGQIRADWSDGFIMYGMSNTSPKLTFMAEGTTQEGRNEALHFLLALHNHYKQKYGDHLPMDLSENDFFKDPSFATLEPDTITIIDDMAQRFMIRLGIEI